jgi:probable F420-dependent oxidoreductase
MNLGIYVRNMGSVSTTETIAAAATAAERAGLHSVWVVDHIAIPPDQSSGSDGRYLDPLATLAFLAGKTQHIGLGVAVLVLPYRPALATAKWVATIQELSGNRMHLGVGSGWMKEEFAAVGVARSRRGAISDEMLQQFESWFGADEVESNGQPFLFKPRPPLPPIYVGGGSRAALGRAVRFGQAWMPMSSDPDKLVPAIAELATLADEAGRPRPTVVPVAALPTSEISKAVDLAGRLREIGCSGLIHGCRYADAGAFADEAGRLAEVGAALG